MKLKWPKFLTVKRTILLVLLVFVIIFALVYFLGGYDATTLKTDMAEFEATGFKSYQEYLEDEVKANEEEFETLVNELTVSNFDSKFPEVEAKCKAVHFYTLLDEKLESLRTQDSANADKYKTSIKVSELISEEDNARLTLNEYRLAVEKLDSTNTGYRLYLNYCTTVFKIVRVENNVEVNEWYSNPNNLDYAGGNGSTLNNQKSPIILHYYTPSGATLPYNVFEYSVTNLVGSEDTTSGTSESIPQYIEPSFSYKFDAENGILQVYYSLEKKGDKYYDFPKHILKEDFDNLIKQNHLNVLAEVKKIRQFSEEELQAYFDEHCAVTYIRNQLHTKADDTPTTSYSRYAKIGVEAYEFVAGLDPISKTGPNLDEVRELFEAMSLAEKRKYVEVMYRLEYEYVDAARTDYKNAKIARDDVTSMKAYYTIDTDMYEDENGNMHEYYTIELYDNMSDSVKQYLKQTLIKKLNYTKEQLVADQERFEVKIDALEPAYKLCVQYQLTEDGFSATILKNSVYESIPDKYPVAKVDLLPYFSAISSSYNLYADKDAVKQFASKVNDCDYVYTGVSLPNKIHCPECSKEHEAKDFVEIPIEQLESNGYMIIPDGSGGVIKLNNGKLSYSKRVYTTDLAFINEVKPMTTEDILLPMYAFSYDSVDFTTNNNKDFLGSSIITRITKGAPQMVINAHVSSGSDQYNRVYYAATFREAQAVSFGPAYDKSEIVQPTKTSVATDFTVEYSLINETGLTYSDIAKRYQEKLFGDILEEDLRDQTHETVLNADYLGVYDYTTNFLGIVYDGHDTLTTYSQAVEITKQLKAWGANHINVMYLGWQKSGLVNETFNDMEFTKRLGSKDELQSMIDYFGSNDVTLYPQVSFVEVNKFKESFGKIRYASRDVTNEFTEKYPYDLASGIFDKQKRAIYTISPKFFDVFAEQLIENFTKNNEELHAMSFEKLGSKMVGDYKKRQEFFRFNSVVEQIGVFEKLEANKIDNISLTAPYEFAVKYADNIVELPYSSTLLDIFDYSIPFYQLVFSGYRDYSGLVINAYDEKGLNNHIMKILETGSNIEFTFSYDSSDELIQTDYNYYYYTQYSDWAKEVTSLLTVLDGLELHKYYLASHDIVNDNHSLFKVTYKVKPECASSVTDSEFSIYLNYSDVKINLGLNGLTYIDIENSDETYNPFKNKTEGGVLNPWSCATDKEVA